MPRPKGSKNKVTLSASAPVDYAALIAGKQSAKETTANEIESIKENIKALQADLKARKAELKKLDKDIAHLTEKKAAADQKAAEEAKNAEAINLVKQVLASGTTADEILELLK